jgi:hypothetical protein
VPVAGIRDLRTGTWKPETDSNPVENSLN